MNTLPLTLVLLLVSTLSLAAPTQVDNTTLLANGLQAQELNAKFANLDANSSCTGAFIIQARYVIS